MTEINESTLLRCVMPTESVNIKCSLCRFNCQLSYLQYCTQYYYTQYNYTYTYMYVIIPCVNNFKFSCENQHAKFKLTVTTVHECTYFIGSFVVTL